jgi:high-affinity iron transporter
LLYPFLITLREGLEAALILGILLAYLTKLGREEAKALVWAGTGLALAFSLLGGLGLHWLAGGLSGKAMEAFEGITMLVAAAILSMMILTMQKHARSLKGELQTRVDEALASGARWGLGALAFSVVGREGIETVLFLVGGAAKADSGPLYALAGVAGGLVAAVLGWMLYRGSLRLNLRRFFTISGILLILFAAGLVANGIKELHEARWVPTLIDHVWDTYDILSDTTTGGRMLAALLGYDASPSLMQVSAYFAYLLVVGGLFTQGLRTTMKHRT